MKKILFVLLFFSVTMQAGYIIHLGLYKNRPALQKMVDRIAKSELRSNVTIEKRGELHWAHSYTIEDMVSAKQALRHYRKVFNDAFISKVRIHPKNAQRDTTAIETQSASRKKDTENIEKHSLERRLRGNLFYVCLETADKALLAVAFDGKHVAYNTIIGDAPSLKERYDVRNDRLYTFNDSVDTDAVYETLDKVTKRYLLISYWHEEEKVNTLRYYYKLEDALAYIKREG